MPTPSISDLEKLGKPIGWFYKLFQSHFEHSSKEDNINAQFRNILTDIAEKKLPVIIADKVGIALSSKILQLQNGMKDNQEEFYNLMIELVRSIENQLELSIHVWKDRVIYFRDVTKIWIACEPMLDLVDTEEGSFDILERQLKHVEEIVYFLHDDTYYKDLKKILQEKNLESSKLRCIKLENKYPFPVVIYHTKNYKHGMSGKYHPLIKKDTGGKYQITKEMDKNWLSYLTKDFIHIHYEKLNEYINK